MFPIYYGNEKCGDATIKKEGLYYRVVCKCHMPTENPCKIAMQVGERDIRLGTCIKVGNHYMIDTKIPCKHIEDMNLRFQIHINGADSTSGLIPVSENGPFPHLHKLDKARMRHHSGQTCIVFTE